MSFHDSKLSKYVTKLSKFLKFPAIPAENSVIPENSRGNSWDAGFPGIPDREFPVALNVRYSRRVLPITSTRVANYKISTALVIVRSPLTDYIFFGTCNNYSVFISVVERKLIFIR